MDISTGVRQPLKTCCHSMQRNPRFNSTTYAKVNPYLKLSLLAISVTCSLISLAWSLVVYHRSLRYTYPHKNNISLVKLALSHFSLTF